MSIIDARLSCYTKRSPPFGLAWQDHDAVSLALKLDGKKFKNRSLRIQESSAQPRTTDAASLRAVSRGVWPGGSHHNMTVDGAVCDSGFVALGGYQAG